MTGSHKADSGRAGPESGLSGLGRLAGPNQRRLTQRPTRPRRHSAKPHTSIAVRHSAQSTRLATLFQVAVQCGAADTQLTGSRADIALTTVQYTQRMLNAFIPEICRRRAGRTSRHRLLYTRKMVLTQRF